MQYDMDIDFADDIDLYDNLEFDVVAGKVQDGVDIEKLVMAVRKARAEVEFLKQLKKRRVEPIDVKIAKLEQNEEKLRDFILELMPQHFPKQNSVDFPGIGKISQRKMKGKWVLTDEEAFIGVLKTHGLYDEVVKIQASVDKRKVPNAVSRILADSSEQELVGVEFQEPEKDVSLVVKIYDESGEEPEDDNNVGF